MIIAYTELSFLQRQYSSLGLPFQNEVNTGFGILVKVYIDATVAYNDGVQLTDANAQTPEAQAAKESAIGILQDTFVTVKSPEDELKRGFRFWDAVCRFSREPACAFILMASLSISAVYRSQPYGAVNRVGHYSRALPRLRANGQMVETLQAGRYVGRRVVVVLVCVGGILHGMERLWHLLYSFRSALVCLCGFPCLIFAGLLVS